jgi:hypothetical protein
MPAVGGLLARSGERSLISASVRRLYYGGRMGLEADAVSIATGDLMIVDSADALERAEKDVGRPIAVAMHRTDEWCTVLFLIKQTDGHWRDEVVPMRDGEVRSWGGGTGGIVRRSQVMPDAPHLDGIGRTGTDGDTELVQLSGVSADDRVEMLHGSEVVAQAPVAAHGCFLLTAVLPVDAEVSVRSGGQTVLG